MSAVAGARATARISARHLEGRLLPHELASIFLRRRFGPLLLLVVMGAVPVLCWAPDPMEPTGCGPHDGAGPHAAWFRCTVAHVESHYMSDFPTLHYLATMSERYQQAIERDEPATIQETEDELVRTSGEPSAQAREGGRRASCPASIIAFCD